MTNKKPRTKPSRADLPAPRQASVATPRETKDRVLQARVSASLYDDLVDQARRLRVPVSNLVRNILEDSLRMVENLVDGGLEIAKALGPRATDAEIAAVLGWQPLRANRTMPCRRCGREIPKGGAAFLSVGAPGARPLVICEDCQCQT